MGAGGGRDPGADGDRERAAGGAAGDDALGLSDMAIRKLENKPPGPSLRVDDLPVVRSFYRMDPARATVYESDLYKLRDDVDKIYKSVCWIRSLAQ
mgnify:CR=1 FL=1